MEQPLKLVKYALDSTVTLVSGGEAPTSALEKVSRELDLNENYIQRTGEALNVALHYNHFKKAGADKSSDFPVADISFVKKAIFGEKEKTLEQKKAEWFPQVVEDIDYNKLLANPGYKKASEKICKTNADFNEFDTSVQGQYKKAIEYLSHIDRDIDEFKTEKVSHEVYLEGAFNSLVKTFTKEASYRPAFHDFETQVYAEHGDRAVPYLDLIYKAARLKEDRGDHTKGFINHNPCNELGVFGSMLKAATNITKIATELKEAEDFQVEQRAVFKEAGQMLNPAYRERFKKTCLDLNEELDFVFEKSAEDKKDGPKPKLHKSLIMNLWKTYQDSKKLPSATFPNTALDNHERVALIQDLIMTDPILSKLDPRKVLNAYQQVLKLSPHLSKEKEVARAILRQLTATQALGPMEANQYIEANTNLLKQHKLMHEERGEKDKDDKKGNK